jgi:hypothetical protein
MSQQSVQLDPLNSPHPIPWNWVMVTAQSTIASAAKLHYYRSQSLISPDGVYAAYSRIQMQVGAEFFHSRVSSVLFVENLKTGDLQAITPTAPLADNPFMPEEDRLQGSISIVIPVSWSETGSHLLAREFESLFCSDMASDYAVIVNLPEQRVSTIAPTRIQYTYAVLLGWSASHPTQALFRVGELGNDLWHLWTVDVSGQTLPAQDDRPVTFGQSVSSVWMGPQG